MTSLLESEARLSKRAAEVKLSDAALLSLRDHGFVTLGQLAYSVGQPGQAISDAAFSEFVRENVPRASGAVSACLRTGPCGPEAAGQ